MLKLNLPAKLMPSCVSHLMLVGTPLALKIEVFCLSLML